MIRVKDIEKEIKIVERNKIPLEVNVLGIATYILQLRGLLEIFLRYIRFPKHH